MRSTITCAIGLGLAGAAVVALAHGAGQQPPPMPPPGPDSQYRLGPDSLPQEGVPRGEIKGIRMTRLGHRVYREKVVQETDPRGRPYYWIGAGPPEWQADEASDMAAVHAGYASVTPLHLDLTHFGALGRMTDWEGSLTALLKKPAR